MYRQVIFDYFFSHDSLITSFVEYVSAVTGLFCIKKYQSKIVSYFVYYLLFIAIADTISYYPYYVRTGGVLEFLIGTKFEKNHWWSTLFWSIGAITFLSYYFIHVLKTKIFRYILKYITLLFLLYSFILIVTKWDVFFGQYFISINLFGALIVLLCSIFYFVEILLNDEILTFYKSINFYISATIFIWWLITTPLIFYKVYLFYEVGGSHFDMNFRYLKRLIYLLSNIFMYSTFTFALIWCKPENK